MLKLKLATTNLLHPLEGDEADAELAAETASGPIARATRQLTRLSAGRAAAEGPDAQLEWIRRHDDDLASLLPRLMSAAHSEALSVEPTARIAAQLAQRLMLGVHDGFKRIVVERSRETGLFQARRVVEALSLALTSGWRLLCLHARLYTPVPEGFWRDCHALFAYARAHGWDGKSPGGREARLGAIYRRLVLLGMTAANRLEPVKIELLIELIEREADSVDLIALREWSGEGGAFVFGGDSDLPPRFVEPKAGGASDERSWVVDVRPLVEALGRRVEILQSSGRADPHELQLLLRLRQEWGDPPRRRHARRQRPGSDEVELVSTLSACWRLAREEGGIAQAAAWNLPLEDGEADEGEVAAAARLRICNSSASGMLLEGEAGGHLLRTGEMVMVRRRGRWWQLGLVRWVAFRGNAAESQCGIEIVAAAPAAVLLMPVISHAGGAYRRAMSLRRGRVLVAAGRLFQPGREFLVAGGGEPIGVRATRLVLQSACYQVIEVTR